MWLCCCSSLPERVSVCRYEIDGTLVWRNLPYDPDDVSVDDTILGSNDGAILFCCEDNSNNGLFVTYRYFDNSDFTLKYGITRFSASGVRTWNQNDNSNVKAGPMTSDSSGNLYVLHGSSVSKLGASDGVVDWTKTTTDISSDWSISNAIGIKWLANGLYLYGSDQFDGTYVHYGLKATSSGALDKLVFRAGGGVSPVITINDILYNSSSGKMIVAETSRTNTQDSITGYGTNHQSREFDLSGNEANMGATGSVFNPSLLLGDPSGGSSTDFWMLDLSSRSLNQISNITWDSGTENGTYDADLVDLTPDGDDTIGAYGTIVHSGNVISSGSFGSAGKLVKIYSISGGTHSEITIGGTSSGETLSQLAPEASLDTDTPEGQGFLGVLPAPSGDFYFCSGTSAAYGTSW